MGCLARSTLPMAMRQRVGENKRRFIDLENGFDLDIAYVNPRLIAMSVPATGCTALYRNPLYSAPAHRVARALLAPPCFVGRARPSDSVLEMAGR